MPKCPNCGAEIPEDSSYCLKCGANVSEIQEGDLECIDQVYEFRTNSLDKLAEHSANEHPKTAAELRTYLESKLQG